ncbi:hypothetical protein KRMM14A1259_47190 [Krasilnikovia sp. MM14-A1259]
MGTRQRHTPEQIIPNVREGDKRIGSGQRHGRGRQAVGDDMGTWDAGPFDNDNAADWCGELHDAAVEQRVALIRRALTIVADCGADDYLDGDMADEAVAAAAVVASRLPGGPPITSGYAPAFLRDGGNIALPGDLPALAVRALDRVDGENSELRGLWGAGYSQVLEERRPIRSALERGAAAP